MSNIALSSEEQFKINQTEAYLNGSKNFIIDTPETFAIANIMLHEIHAKKNELDAMRKKLKAPIDEAGKAVEEFFRQPIHFLTQSEQQYKVKLIKYQDAIESERAIKRTEAAIKAEALTAKAVEALKANDAVEYADSMLKLGEVSRPIETHDTDGLSFRNNWKGRVVDLQAFIRAVAEDRAPARLLVIDESELNALARSIRDTVSYPGIEFFNDRVLAVKAVK